MSHATLQPNSLYFMLFIRGDPPQTDDFHWALYLHQEAHNGSGGTKYHIKTEGSGSGWITEHGCTVGVLKAFLLVGLFRIADIRPGVESRVDQRIRSCDSMVNRAGVTCKVWIFWVLELLREEIDGYVPLKCEDLLALDREAQDWANLYASGAATNEQPRPVGSSLICGL